MDIARTRNVPRIVMTACSSKLRMTSLLVPATVGGRLALGAVVVRGQSLRPSALIGDLPMTLLVRLGLLAIHRSTGS